MPRIISTERNETRSARPRGWGGELGPAVRICLAPLSSSTVCRAGLHWPALSLLAPSVPLRRTRTWPNSGACSGSYSRRTANFRDVSARWRARRRLRRRREPSPGEAPGARRPPTDISASRLSSAAARHAPDAQTLPEPRDTTGMGLDERVKVARGRLGGARERNAADYPGYAFEERAEDQRLPLA